MRVPVIEEHDEGGLATFRVETPPPLTAFLAFRVGHWDETVLNRGITHLVEHLALHPLRDVPHEFNGSVAGDFTTFWAAGTEEELQAFFRSLSRSLTALPFDRLDAEARVLQAETSGRPAGPIETLLTILLGPNGPGLLAYPERGFDLVGPREAQAWADRHFTRDNAVLMLLGPRRPDIRVDLPPGMHRPYVLPGPELGYRPQQLEAVDQQPRGICMGAFARRTAEAVLAWHLLDQRLTRRLRHELGLIYSVGTSYLPVDARTAFVYAGVDAMEGQEHLTASHFMEVVRGLRDQPPDADELERLKKKLGLPDEFDEAAFARTELSRVAVGRLLGYEPESWEQLESARAAATPEGVHEAFREAVRCAAVIPPSPIRLGLPERRKRSWDPVEGKRFRRWSNHGPGSLTHLVIGPEGISVRCDARWVTVLWRNVVLAECTGGSHWTMLDRNGSWVQIETASWWRGRTISRLIRDRVPDPVLLPRPRRE